MWGSLVLGTLSNYIGNVFVFSFIMITVFALLYSVLFTLFTNKDLRDRP